MRNKDDALRCLKDYISASEPQVNMDLRQGKYNPDVDRLETLFVDCDNKTTVYRGLPGRFATIEIDKYHDKGYISTSKEITDALRFALEEDPTLLVIELSEKDRIIDVMKHLPNSNNEDELILQHGLTFQVMNSERYSHAEPDLPFEEFERKFSPNERMCDFSRLNVLYLIPLTV